MFEVYKSVSGPKLVPQFLAGNNLSRPLQQDRQNLKRLLLETNPLSALAQLSGGEVDLKDAEANDARRGRI